VPPSDDMGLEWDSMSGQRVRRPVSDWAGSIILFAASATKLLSRGKVLLPGAFAALLAVVAVPILFEADMPSVAADGTLKCYDSSGNHEPCVAQASASPSRFSAEIAAVLRPPSWTTTALLQQSDWTTPAVDQPANWTTAAADQPANETTTAVDQPANGTSEPVGRRSFQSARRHAMAICRRHLIPCFFSTLRKGLTHIASVAATMGRARPVREHL
jgi:hypothetical protein